VAEDRPGPVSVPTLVMTGGPLDGTAYPLPLTGRDVIVGSSMDSDVQIMLGNVEPAHATIGFAGNQLVLKDAGSATGTFLNGEKVEAAQPLAEGDRICLGPPGAKGSAKLLVRLPGGIAVAPRAAQVASAADAGGRAPAFGDPGSSFFNGDDAAKPEFDLGGIAEQAFSADGETAEHDSLFGKPLSASPAEAAVTSRPSTKPAPAPAPPPPPPAQPVFGTAPPTPAAPAPPAQPTPPPPPPAVPPPAPAPRSTPPTPVASERLTSPAPAEKRARADYQAELPSIPFRRSEEPEMRPEPFLPLQPAPKTTPPRGSKGRGSARRSRGLSLPSLPLPLIGGLAAIALLAALVWLFLLRATPPELTTIAPVAMEPGQSVKLSGRHFAKDAGGNTVTFGAKRAQVTAASGTELTVVVPAGVQAKVPVAVETKGGRSQAVIVTVASAARATAVEPEVALPGQTVLIRGEGFEGQRISVLIGGTAAAFVEASPEGVRAVVPAIVAPEGSKAPVVVQAGDKPPKTFELLLGRLPLVMDVSPKRGGVGEVVTLSGRGFSPDPRANAVTFAGQPAVVLAATDHELKVVVPAPASGDVSPDLAVVVTAGGRSSSGTAAFGVSRAASSGFVPRFYPTPVVEFPGEGLVFVATEIGPVLLVGGPGEQRSTAERAMSVASRLNALVAGAATRPPAFETREKPQPSVAVVGEVRPFLTPTLEDVAAYGKPWPSGRGPTRHVTQAALARHWAAVLQDYLGLFLYRQRPLQVLTLSPRGRVLSDIYSEASRRAPGGTTVPASVLLPTGAGMAAALREMALVVAADSGRAAVAVEGRWDGTIEDPDLGTRLFQLQLRAEGGRLGGEITTWRGKVELKAPVRDAGFDRGSVRFTVDQQGTAYRFKGQLEGNTVNGTIERSGKAPVRFSMQYLD
jgi:hypothetical protein